MPNWFVWHPILKLETHNLTAHDFKAVYSSEGSVSQVSFYVDGKLAWATLYPNVSSQSFHLALCSHKVSSQNTDTSQNSLQIAKAYLAAE